MYKEISIEQLVTKAKQGSEREKEIILQQFNPLLLKYSMKYFGMNQDFDDWLQEGRLVILRAIKDYNSQLGVPFAAYVQKQVFYHYINERKKVREEVILDQPLWEGGSLIDLLTDEKFQVENIILNREQRRILLDALSILTPKQRDVIIGFYFNKKNLKFLAKEKNICYQSIICLKARALAKMRKIK